MSLSPVFSPFSARLRATAKRWAVLDQRGFSLAEALVTITISGALLAVALPNFSDLREHYQLRGAMQEIFVSLQKARSASVTENNRYRVSLVDANHYQLHDDENNNNTVDAGEEKVTRDIRVNSPEVSLTSDGVVTFLPNGRRLNPGSTTFTLSHSSGHTKQVVVNAAGRIKIN